MSIKQDRTGTRTSEDLRRRINVKNIEEATEKVDASVEQVQKLSNQVGTLSGQVKGLNDSVTNTRESYVSTNAQTFTEEQKTRARNNIGAGNSSFSGSYNDLKNKPDLSKYITEETDPTVPSYVKNIKQEDINKWNSGTGSSGITGDTLPIGSMIPYGKATPPTNWLVCDGSAVSRTTYSELFAVIGTSYGAGDGSTTFNLPNKKGRVSVGLDTSDTDFNTIGKTGGEKKHTLTVAEMPSHSHTLKSYGSPGGGYGGNATAVDSDRNLPTNETGGNQPHNNLQPYQVDNWIIKAKQSSGVVGNVLNSKSNSTTDTYSCEYTNNLDVAVYDGGTIDPNTTTEGLILTRHANNPYGENNFAYIRTIFYGSKANTSNRTQIAYPYKVDKSIYKRFYLSGVWSEWTPAVEDTKTYDLSTYKVSGLTILRSSCIVKNNRVVINFVGTKSMAANTTTELFDLPVELTPTDSKDFVVFGQSSDTTGYVGYGYITTSGSLQVRFTQAVSSYIRFSVTYDLD